MHLHSVAYEKNGKFLSPENSSQNYTSIKIKILRLRTLIGFNPEKTIKRQDLVINFEIASHISPAVLEDKVSEALNYKVITKQVIEFVEGNSFLLLEKLVSDVHYCVKSQGVKDSNPQTINTALGGCFRENILSRAEFLNP